MPELVNYFSPAKIPSFYHLISSNNLDFFWINKEQDLAFLVWFETVNKEVYAIQITLGFYSLTILFFFICLNIHIKEKIGTASEVKIFWSSLFVCILMFVMAFVFSDTHAIQESGGRGLGRLLMLPIRAYLYPLILYEFLLIYLFALSFNMAVTTAVFAVIRKTYR